MNWEINILVSRVQAQEKIGGEDPFYRVLGLKWLFMGGFMPQLSNLSVKIATWEILAHQRP